LAWGVKLEGVKRELRAAGT